MGSEADRLRRARVGLGLGGIVGTVGAPPANRLFGRRWVMFANVFFTCSMVAVPAMAANVWAVGTAACIGGMGGTLWVVNTRIISQTLVSAGLFGYRLAFGVFDEAATVLIVPLLRIFTPEVLAGMEARISARLNGCFLSQLELRRYR